jgi:hypothetical protein
VIALDHSIVMTVVASDATPRLLDLLTPPPYHPPLV